MQVLAINRFSSIGCVGTFDKKPRTVSIYFENRRSFTESLSKSDRADFPSDAVSSEAEAEAEADEMPLSSELLADRISSIIFDKDVERRITEPSRKRIRRVGNTAKMIVLIRHIGKSVPNAMTVRVGSAKFQILLDI